MAKKTTIHPEDNAGERESFRTGPNVDIGLEPGAVTLDPQTAAGQAAAAAREANGAKSTMTDEGVEVVVPKDPTYAAGKDPRSKAPSGIADPDAPAVDEVSAAVKKKDPTTIANEPDDIKGDPKADVQ